jgi:LRR receptor-like serine/threonine-protein kinase ERECTA
LSGLFLNDSKLSGTISPELGKLYNIKHLVLANNRFTGDVSKWSFVFITRVPKMASLKSIVLNGLHRASHCSNKVWKGVPFGEGIYYSKLAIHGGIPNCLFSMVSLDQLQLAGNGIVGSLPRNLNVSRDMLVLSLSHNSFSGEIPLSLLQGTWTLL